MMKRRLQLLMKATPGFARVGYLSIGVAELDASAQAAAKSLNLELQFVDVQRAEDLDRAIDTGRPADGWLIDDYGPLAVHMQRIIELIARTRKPAIYGDADWVRVGGLMSYSDDRKDVQRYVARYVDRILRGAKPADLPVEQPSRFALTINMKTARALSLTIPSSLLLLADEVIE